MKIENDDAPEGGDDENQEISVSEAEVAELEADHKPEEGQQPPAEGRLAEGGEEEEVEEPGEDDKPARPKKTSKQRRDERRASERRVREERDFLVQQVNEMRQRLSQVEGNALESHHMTVDSRLSECLNDAEQAERLEIAAREAKDVEGELQARRIREKANSQAGHLKTEKERLAGMLAQRKSQPAPSAPVPGAEEITAQAAQFRANKPWVQFAQNGAPLNAESAVALSIDHALNKEGKLSQRDPAYWRELDKRVKAALPHMFQPDNTDQEDDIDDDEEELEVDTTTRQQPQQRPAKPAVVSAGKKGPAVGSSGRQQNAAQSGSRLSAERVAALKEIGAWEDPKQRAEYIAEYKRYDKARGIN